MTPLTSLQKTLGVLILLVLVFFSLYRISESPLFGFDEGWAVQVATNIAQLGEDGLQFSPGTIQHVSVLTSIGYTLLYPLALFFKLFGAGILQARLMMALYMLGFAALSFMLLRRLYGNAIALASLGLLVTFPPFYTFGKSVIGEVPVLFFLVLFLLFFYFATYSQNRRIFWFTMAGMAAGLCVVTKTMALAFVPVLFIGAYIAIRKGLTSWKEIGVIAVSAIVPITVWIIVNFQPGDSLASVADYYTNPSALTDKSATFWLNLKILFTRSGSLFMLSWMGIWVIGVLIRIKDSIKIRLEESVALAFAVVILFSLLFRYFDARYLFPIQVLGILFAPYSLYYIARALPMRIDAAKRTRICHIGILILCLAGLYQVSFSSFIADSYRSTRTADVAAYFSGIPATTSILFYNAPHVVPAFKGRNYHQRIAMFEKWVLGSDYSPLIAPGGADMLVLNPQMTKRDETVSLVDFVEVARFGETSILKRKVK